jgi:methylthioribose-1-phosphate isomerase
MPEPRDTLTVDWDDGVVRMIDQRRLPAEFVVLELRDYEAVADAIRTMAVRGAPAIGVSAALGLALAARAAADAPSSAAFWEAVRQADRVLRATRPTAVNLFWGLDRALSAAERLGDAPPAALAAAVKAEARAMIQEDIAINRTMGHLGAALLPAEGNVLTHCNTGSLATVHYGTALGMIRAAVEEGKRLHVWVDETRPRLQGMKLTAWECQQLGIPATVIADNMSASLMRRGEVDAVVVGADRIAANGDTANKIGTYAAAVLARAHGIPFYVVAPLSTIDFSLPTGDLIPIEERDPREVTEAGPTRLAPEGVAVYNPAFDVTPAEFVTAIVTERGLARSPYRESLAQLRNEGEGPER